MERSKKLLCPVVVTVWRSEIRSQPRKSAVNPATIKAFRVILIAKAMSVC
jgi:hypothetical protein